MKPAVRPPTHELVAAVCKEFDRTNTVVEQALGGLFSLLRGNGEHSHVLLKVAALNSLYHTQIFAVFDVAIHIHRNAEEIDDALADGRPEIIEKIAKIEIHGKVRNNFSFASKYCSWHNQLAYPIYDSIVDKYLWSLQKQDHFAAFFTKNEHLWDYPRFVEIMIAFRNRYGLESFTFKQIDKFLWSQTGEPLPQIDGNVINTPS